MPGLTRLTLVIVWGFALIDGIAGITLIIGGYMIAMEIVAVVLSFRVKALKA